jgi:hypothetical protein
MNVGAHTCPWVFWVFWNHWPRTICSSFSYQNSNRVVLLAYFGPPIYQPRSIELSHSSQSTAYVIESEICASKAEAAVIFKGQAESRPNFSNPWISLGLMASTKVGEVMTQSGTFDMISLSCHVPRTWHARDETSPASPIRHG